ncbi:glycosyltransferase [Thalassotalea litorea]|uniref:glycosyltransferase n=1 Tax=Thalassotalea litorea TaxID=2020715 RepID=UPI0037353B72
MTIESNLKAELSESAVYCPYVIYAHGLVIELKHDDSAKDFKRKKLLLNKEVEMEINVSVIIPFFSRSELFLKVLQSVFTQSAQPQEIVLLEGIFEHPEFESIHVYKKQTNITYLDAQLSLEEARQKGAELASGKYITFLEPNELWMVDKLKDQYDFLESHSYADAVYGGCCSLDDFLYKSKPELLQANDILFKEKKQLTSVMLKTATYRHIAGVDLAIPKLASWDLCIQLAANGYEQFCFRHISIPLATENESGHDKCSHLFWREHSEVLEKHRPLIQKRLGNYGYYFLWYRYLLVAGALRGNLTGRVIMIYANMMKILSRTTVLFDLERNNVTNDSLIDKRRHH